MTARADTAEQRARIFAALTSRNRIIAILRVGVPALGVLVFLVLAAQIYLASLARQFGIGNISVNGTTVTVDTPTYAGVLADGTTYKVSASAAEAAITAMDVIELKNTSLVMVKPNGVTMLAKADSAALQTTDQLIEIPTLASVADSTGTKGTLVGAVFNWPRQTLVTSGRVHFELSGGTTLDAEKMTYDGKTRLWGFSGVTLVMPYTPGEKL